MQTKFLEYLEFEKRYSNHTIISYRKDLSDFSVFCLEKDGLEDIKEANKIEVRNFLMHLTSQGISKRSVNRKLSSLRSFYSFLMKIEEIKISPVESVQSLKFYADKQIPFSQDEMQQLKTEVEDKSQINLLDKLIIETLYQTGMRKAELCGLLLENVDLTKKELKVLGKGNKERFIPISDELVADFKKYIEIRHPLAEFEKYFFINKKGKKLGEKFVYMKVNSYLSLVTTKKKKSPHILRHSFATHVLDNGAEISKVKNILGHASLASTQVYTDANIEQLKKVLNQAHPRAIKKEDL
jgi:integrase/recombinase XerC